MASIHKRPRSPYYHAYFTDHTGKLRSRSTKTRDAREARRIADGLEEAYRTKKTEAQLRRAFTDLSQEVLGRPLKFDSLNEYFGRWLAAVAPGLKKATVAGYKASIGMFIKYLGDKADDDINNIEPSDVHAWRDALLRSSSSVTAINKLKGLSAMLSSAYKDGVLREDVAGRIRLPKKESDTERRPFTEEELAALFKHADDDWKGIMTVALYTAQRLGDICCLDWSCVDTTTGMVSIVAAKTGRRTNIPMAPSLLAWAKDRKVRGASGPVFPAQASMVARGGTSPVSQSFATLMEKAGIIAPRVKSKHGRGVGRATRREVSEISFHSFRYTATSYMKRAGIPEAVVMDIVGHESKAVSRHYTAMDDKSKREAMGKLDAVVAPLITKVPPHGEAHKADKGVTVKKVPQIAPKSARGRIPMPKVGVRKPVVMGSASSAKAGTPLSPAAS